MIFDKSIGDILIEVNLLAEKSNIVFPDRTKFLSDFIHSLNLIEFDRCSSTKDVVVYKREKKKLNDLLSSCNSLDEITFISNNGTPLKIRSIFLLDDIHTMLKDEQMLTQMPPKYQSKKVNKNSFNKATILKTEPIYRHLKTNNSNLSKSQICQFIKDLLLLMGFDCKIHYPYSIEPTTPFTNYYSL